MPAGRFRSPHSGKVVCFDGQSLNMSPAAPHRFPDFAMAPILHLVGSYHVTADFGEHWTNLDDDLPSRLYDWVTRAAPDDAGLVMQGGQTALQLGADGDTMYTTTANYALDAKNNGGFAWVVYTTVPPGGTAVYDVNMEANRVEHNAAAITDSLAAFDAVVDIASILALGTGDFIEPDIEDELHLSVQGARKIGAALTPVLAGLLAA